MKTPEAIVIDCEAAMRRLWDYLDEELDAARLAEMEAHLATCAGCTSHVQFARAFLQAVQGAALAEAPVDDRLRVSASSLKERVVAQLRREGFRSTSQERETN